MRQIKLFILIFVTVSLSCKQASKSVFEQTESVSSETEVVAPPLVVRLQKGEGSTLAELKLSFAGHQRIEEQLNEQKETVQNLVIQAVSDFSFESLQSTSGKADFQTKLLSSLNEFVDHKSFEKINILEIKEI